MKNVMPHMPNSACSKTKKVTPCLLGLLSEWANKGPYDRDKAKGEMWWKAFFEQRCRGIITEEPHEGLGCAKQMWLGALEAIGGDPS